MWVRFGVGVCVFSMIVAVVFYKVEQRAEHRYGGVIFSKKHIDTSECVLQQCWTELKEIKLLSGAVDFLMPTSALVFLCVGGLH